MGMVHRRALLRVQIIEVHRTDSRHAAKRAVFRLCSQRGEC
jgi:hypothetical protein